jgi:mono/diheme cytochrome c family protein
MFRGHHPYGVIRHHLAALAALLFVANAATAADPPREMWVKAKCALCHGIDGSGDNDRGKKLHTPDLRAPETQKQSDELLAKAILSGHGRMPSFASQRDETVRLLVVYIRSLNKGSASQAARR